MNKPAPIFEKSASEVLERLRDDYSLEAMALKEEAVNLVHEFRACTGVGGINAALITRLFSLYRRAMNYLIDRRNKFWQYCSRPEFSPKRRKGS